VESQSPARPPRPGKAQGGLRKNRGHRGPTNPTKPMDMQTAGAGRGTLAIIPPGLTTNSIRLMKAAKSLWTDSAEKKESGRRETGSDPKNERLNSHKSIRIVGNRPPVRTAPEVTTGPRVILVPRRDGIHTLGPGQRVPQHLLPRPHKHCPRALVYIRRSLDVISSGMHRVLFPIQSGEVLTLEIIDLNSMELPKDQTGKTRMIHLWITFLMHLKAHLIKIPNLVSLASPTRSPLLAPMN
jgi:hypothetical protein